MTVEESILLGQFVYEFYLSPVGGSSIHSFTNTAEVNIYIRY